ncbi:hypothetical protein [Peredibacter starrii]|uniref:Uncharacterized protein n=1 Tax=Peredibacter starrii TaxID=28202 RepID=A0AAX4HRL3_9BACT|nr:hypothetical protein [Peredibacter starrii]WPU65995.1 hypothetical protein SOO65_04485 [Peredibacter starrii]
MNKSMATGKWTLSVIALSILFSEASIAKSTGNKLTLLQCFKLQTSLRYGHINDRDKATKADITKTHELLKGLNYSAVVPWSPKKREIVRRFGIEKLEMDELASKYMPLYDKTQKIGKAKIKVNDIRWSQMAANNVSQDGKYTIVGNAKAIKDGSLNITKLPTIRVWRDVQGRVWTLDHRRLAAIKLSGVIDEIEVEFVAESLVKEQKFKFSNRDEGRTIFLYMDEKDAKSDKAIVLSREENK